MHGYKTWKAVAETARWMDKGKPIASNARLFLHENGDLEFRYGDHEWGIKNPTSRWKTYSKIAGTRGEKVNDTSTVAILKPNNKLHIMQPFLRQGPAGFIGQHLHLYTFTHRSQNTQYITTGRAEVNWRPNYSWFKPYTTPGQAVDDGEQYAMNDGHVVFNLNTRKFIGAKRRHSVPDDERSREWRRKVRRYHKAYIIMDKLGAPERAFNASGLPKDSWTRLITEQEVADAIESQDFSDAVIAKMYAFSGQRYVWNRNGQGSSGYEHVPDAFKRVYSGAFSRRVRMAAGCYVTKVSRA